MNMARNIVKRLRSTTLAALLLALGTAAVPAAPETAAAPASAPAPAASPGFFSLEWDAAAGYRVRKGNILTGMNLDTHAMRYQALKDLSDARRAQESGSESKALDLYEDLCKKNPGTDIAAEAFYLRGIIHFKRHEFKEAFDSLDVIAKAFPDFDRFSNVIELQYQIATAVKNGERPYFWGWLPWFKDPIIGIDFFERVNRNAPYGKYAAQALFQKGNLALDNDRTDDALDAFERIISDYPESTLVPESWLARARTREADITGHHIHSEAPPRNAAPGTTPESSGTVTGHEWDQGATQDALYCYGRFIWQYTEFVRRDPKFDTDGKLIALAIHNAARMREVLARNRYDLGLFYFEHRNNPRAAALFFHEAINSAPESGVAREARKRIAEIHAGTHASAGLMDWLFGRYAQFKDTSYSPVPPAPDTSRLGFRSATNP
jgi:tetratricopeptide (TPR) repeat protein